MTRRLSNIVLACVVASIVEPTWAQKLPSPSLPWRLDADSTAVIRVPADIREVTGFHLEYADAEPMRGALIDFNGDGVKDYLLQSSERICVSGGCIFVLCDGKSQRKVGTFFGSPLYIRAERSYGYPDVATYDQGGDAVTYTNYRFDGYGYSVAVKQDVEGPALTRLMQSLSRVPSWRPQP